MPYTLMKGLAWILLAVVIGLVVGWLLRSVNARRQVERARAANVGTTDHDELELLRARVAELEAAAVERDRLRAELERERSKPTDDTAPWPNTQTVRSVRSPGDLAAAAAVLGRPVEPDDLTLIDGIDDHIARLCQGIGISTWAELSVTEVSLLRTMLHEAGDRGVGHEPDAWPEQAALLAAGAWDEFRASTEQRTGHPSD